MKTEGCMDISGGGSDPSSYVKYTPHSYSQNELEAFGGIYYCKELEFSISVERNAENTLEIQRLGYENSPLEPITKDIFKNTGLGSVHFDRSTDGRVSGFSIRNENVSFLHFVKVLP